MDVTSFTKDDMMTICSVLVELEEFLMDRLDEDDMEIAADSISKICEPMQTEILKRLGVYKDD